VEQLAPDISRFALIGADFSGPSEGRGYSQARVLREHWKFSGELRATGYVRRDQLFFLVDSVVLGGEQGGVVKLQLKLETYLKTGAA